MRYDPKVPRFVAKDRKILTRSHIQSQITSLCGAMTFKRQNRQNQVFRQTQRKLDLARDT